MEIFPQEGKLQTTETFFEYAKGTLHILAKTLNPAIELHLLVTLGEAARSLHASPLVISAIAQEIHRILILDDHSLGAD